VLRVSFLSTSDSNPPNLRPQPSALSPSPSAFVAADEVGEGGEHEVREEEAEGDEGEGDAGLGARAEACYGVGPMQGAKLGTMPRSLNVVTAAPAHPALYVRIAISCTSGKKRSVQS